MNLLATKDNCDNDFTSKNNIHDNTKDDQKVLGLT